MRRLRNVLTGVWLLLMSLLMLVGYPLFPLYGVLLGFTGIIAAPLWMIVRPDKP